MQYKYVKNKRAENVRQCKDFFHNISTNRVTHNSEETASRAVRDLEHCSLINCYFLTRFSVRNQKLATCSHLLPSKKKILMRKVEVNACKISQLCHYSFTTFQSHIINSLQMSSKWDFFSIISSDILNTDYKQKTCMDMCLLISSRYLLPI